MARMTIDLGAVGKNGLALVATIGAIYMLYLFIDFIVNNIWWFVGIGCVVAVGGVVLALRLRK